MLCVLILYISGGTYSLKSAPNERFFEEHFLIVVLCSQNKFAERRMSWKKCFFIYPNRMNFTSNKPTHYLLDCGELTQLNSGYMVNISEDVNRKQAKIEHKLKLSTLFLSFHCDKTFCCNKSFIKLLKTNKKQKKTKIKEEGITKKKFFFCRNHFVFHILGVCMYVYLYVNLNVLQCVVRRCWLSTTQFIFLFFFVQVTVAFD